MRLTIVACALLLTWARPNGALAAAFDGLHPPGVMIDIGGRRMHMVCAGADSAKPTVVFESGAFGFSADWSIVQSRLAAEGLRGCAYDRAGLGFSDPGPLPRDAMNITDDLQAMLKAAHVPGPYVLVSHSMAGLYVRLFAVRHPDEVAGLVLVDSTTPEAIDDRTTAAYVVGFTRGSRAAAWAASWGFLKILRGTPLGNKIGLDGEAEAEKRFMFAYGPYNKAASEEVEQWPASARQAIAAGQVASGLPVAVIVAGDVHGPMRDVQKPPALRSSHGYVDIVHGARHDALLGPVFCGAIVNGVNFVIAASGTPAAPVILAPSRD